MITFALGVLIYRHSSRRLWFPRDRLGRMVLQLPETTRYPRPHQARTIDIARQQAGRPNNSVVALASEIGLGFSPGNSPSHQTGFSPMLQLWVSPGICLVVPPGGKRTL